MCCICGGVSSLPVSLRAANCRLPQVTALERMCMHRLPADHGIRHRRWHAAIPQAASLDYVRMPQGMQAPEGKGRAKEKQHKLRCG